MNARRLLKTRMARLALGGAVCLCGWLLSLKVNGGTVLKYLERFALQDDGRYLLASAVNLVALNTFRAALLYLGWFYLGESVALSQRARAWSWLVPLAAIPLSYVVVSQYPDLFYLHLGAPALFSILTVLIMHVSTREIRGWLARSLVILMLVFSFQWLDISPLLTHWGFGRGELSTAIKALAIIVDWGWVLDALGIGLFATAFAGGIAAAALLIGASQRSMQFRKIRKRDMEIAALREETVRIRGYQEIQRLVHDLRRPLTTMLGLADVLVETLPNDTSLEYARRLVRTGSDMNQMIEEMLKEDARQDIRVGNMLEYVQSQISAYPWRHIVEAEVGAEVSGRFVRVNLIRFSRALVNLLDNAHLAVENRLPQQQKVLLSAGLRDGQVVLNVVDNGPGFPESNAPGFSQWGSTGIGLVFAEDVVKNHGGEMRITNLPEGGASVMLTLPLQGDV